MNILNRERWMASSACSLLKDFHPNRLTGPLKHVLQVVPLKDIGSSNPDHVILRPVELYLRV